MAWTQETNLRGPQGVQGIQGIQGIQGERGPEGPPGTTTWAGITDKPELAAADHNHDTRYYTQSQVDTMLAEKAGILVLPEGDPLPSGTTDGTIIARTS